MPRRRVVQTTIVRSDGGNGNSYNRLWLWSTIIAFIALLFSIISLSTSGWNGTNLVKNGKIHLSTIVLSFIGIFLLIFSIIFTILFGTRLITSFSNGMKLSVIILFSLSSIFFVSACASYYPHQPNNYSYYLMITTSVFTFISSIIISFWLGQHLHFL